MAATLAQIGYLTLLKMGNGLSPQTYTTIAEVKSINGFGFTKDELEATHMESPNGYKEFVGGMKQGETMTVVCNMTIENAGLTKSTWEAGDNVDFELNLPSTLPDYDFTLTPLGWHILGLQPNAILEIEMTGRITAAIGGA